MGWPILGAIFGRTLLGFATRVGLTEGISWFSSGKTLTGRFLDWFKGTGAGEVVGEKAEQVMDEGMERVSDTFRGAKDKASDAASDFAAESLGVDGEALKESQSWIKRIFGSTNLGTMVGGLLGTFLGGAKTKIGKFFRGILGAVLGTFAVKMLGKFNLGGKSQDHTPAESAPENKPSVLDNTPKATPRAQNDFNETSPKTVPNLQPDIIAGDMEAVVEPADDEVAEASAPAEKASVSAEAVTGNFNGQTTAEEVAKPSVPGVQLSAKGVEIVQGDLSEGFKERANCPVPSADIDPHSANGHFNYANTVGVKIDRTILNAIERDMVVEERLDVPGVGSEAELALDEIT